jgi:hypothetical protein
VFIWYIFSGFGIMHQEKSGNPAEERRRLLIKFSREAAASIAAEAEFLRFPESN